MSQRHPLPSVVKFNQLLTAVTKMKHFSCSLDLFNQMCAIGVPVNEVTMSIAIKCCCQLRRTKDGFALLGCCFRRAITPDVFIFSALLDGLVIQDKILDAEMFFKKLIKQKICEPDVVTYNTMIKGLCKFGNNVTAIALLRLMEQQNCKPSIVTYSTIIDSLCKDQMIDDAFNLFQEMVFEKRITPDVITYTSLICGLSKLGRWDEVLKLLKEMEAEKITPVVQTYTALVDAFCKEGKADEAEAVINIMVERGKLPDIVTYNSLIDGYCLRGDMVRAMAIFDSVTLKGLSPDVFTYNSLLNGYCKVLNIEKAMKIFRVMTDIGLKPDVVTYNTMLHGLFMVGRCVDARTLFDEMHAQGQIPDQCTYRIYHTRFLHCELYEQSGSVCSLQISSYQFPFSTNNFLRCPMYTRGSCLRSLSAARHDTDKVNIHIFIDHFKGLDQKDQKEQDNEYLDRKLNGTRKILDFVHGFKWRFGEKVVHYRTGNVGLQAPLFYRYIKGLIGYYNYNASNYSPSVYGASLQRLRFLPGKHGNKINVNKDTKVFLYQLVGTWGQLLFPKPWKEFHLWYDTHKTKGMKPVLDGMIICNLETTGWYKKMGDRIWTPWFIKFIHERGYFNIYTNFLNESALSVSHRDTGVNYGRTARPDSNLIQESSRENDLFKLEPLRNLKWYDFCFREAVPNRIVTSVNELGPVLKSVQKRNGLVVVSVDQKSTVLTRNLLCHFERLDVWNYVFVGPVSDFLLDLARRGHAVVNADAFFDTLKEYKSIKLRKEVIVKALVVKKALEMKYDTWVLDHNMVPVKADFIVDLVKLNPTVDFYVGKRLGLLFARSSGSGTWNDRFVNEIAQSEDGGGFGFMAGKLLERKGVKLQRFDEGLGFGVEIDAGNDDGVLLKNDTKVVFWSSDAGSGMVQNKLESLGLWIMDGESNCKAVICHPS